MATQRPAAEQQRRAEEDFAARKYPELDPQLQESTFTETLNAAAPGVQESRQGFLNKMRSTRERSALTTEALKHETVSDWCWDAKSPKSSNTVSDRTDDLSLVDRKDQIQAAMHKHRVFRWQGRLGSSRGLGILPDPELPR